MASLGSGSGASGLRNARGALAGNTRVIETVDSALSALDLTHMSTRLKADMNFILTQVKLATLHACTARAYIHATSDSYMQT